MSAKFALIIGNTEYTDPGLAQLTTPSKDADEFARVLDDHEICAFDDVKFLLNQPEHIVRGTIDEFFDQKRPDDLLVLYFSGHSVQDELGTLYLAVNNTNRFRLRSTAIKSNFVYEAMDQSRSKRQVLILDCCNVGAFAHGIKAATDVSIGTATAFEAGYGHVIMTASDSIQLVWEGDKVTGETNKSLFTRFLVEGLEGEADLDGDGYITVDELYNYAFKKVKLATPKQTPLKFTSKEQGAIVLRQIRQIEDIKTMSLADDLISEIEDLHPYAREAAVQRLETIIKGRDINLARSAKEALEKIAADENTTQRVAQIATQVLESIHQVELKGEDEIKGREELEHVAILQAEDEHLASENAEAEQLDNQNIETERLAPEVEILSQNLDELVDQKENGKTNILPSWATVLWITLGYAIGWAIGGTIGAERDSAISWTVGGAIGGATGGFITAVALWIEHVFADWEIIVWMTLGWAIGGAIGGAIMPTMESFTGTIIGGPISWAISGLITAVALYLKEVLSTWKSVLWITLGWTISGAIFQARSNQSGLAICGAIGGAIGGIILVWQIRKEKIKDLHI